MQLPNSPLGKFSKASTLQRLIQLAYSFLFLCFHLKATRQRKVICPTYKRSEIETCLSLPHIAEGPLSPSLLRGETRNTWLLSSIFHVTGWRAAICLHSEVKHYSLCLCGDLLSQSQRLNACSGYWTWRNRACAFFPRALATAHLDCSVARNKLRQQLVRFGCSLNTSHSPFCSHFFCKHSLAVKWLHAAIWQWVVHHVVAPPPAGGRLTRQRQWSDLGHHVRQRHRYRKWLTAEAVSVEATEEEHLLTPALTWGLKLCVPGSKEPGLLIV